MDAERKAKGVRGPMHGIPVLIKDNIDTADRMATSAGSLALAESKAAKDAFIAGRLRESGAVLLGKTNLSEWANFRSTRSSSGWSGRGGQTRNPYALDRNPCGSSSGSGAAVSANLCAVGRGDGNRRVHRVPILHQRHRGHQTHARAGQQVGNHSHRAQPGHGRPHGADREGCRDSARRSCRSGPGRSGRRSASGRIITDYTKFLDPDGLKGARLGVARKFFGFHEKVDALMEDAITVMKRAGRGDRRPRGPSHARQVRRFGMGGAALRIQGGSQCLSRRLGPEVSGPHAEGAHRIQRKESREGNALFSARRFSSRPRPRAPCPTRPIRKRSPTACGCPGRKA